MTPTQHDFVGLPWEYHDSQRIPCHRQQSSPTRKIPSTQDSQFVDSHLCSLIQQAPMITGTVTGRTVLAQGRITTDWSFKESSLGYHYIDPSRHDQKINKTRAIATKTTPTTRAKRDERMIWESHAAVGSQRHLQPVPEPVLGTGRGSSTIGYQQGAKGPKKTGWSAADAANPMAMAAGGPWLGSGWGWRFRDLWFVLQWCGQRWHHRHHHVLIERTSIVKWQRRELFIVFLAGGGWSLVINLRVCSISNRLVPFIVMVGHRFDCLFVDSFDDKVWLVVGWLLITQCGWSLLITVDLSTASIGSCCLIVYGVCCLLLLDLIPLFIKHQPWSTKILAVVKYVSWNRCFHKLVVLIFTKPE